MSKHTQGPLSYLTEGGGVSYVVDKDGRYLATVHPLADGKDNATLRMESRANGRLFAAAPALVEALRDMIQLAIVGAVGNPKFQARVEHASALLAEIDGE